MAAPKVQVNGNSSGHDPTLQSQVTNALLQNGGVKRIQDAFQQRLDEAGWSQALRDYTERLFRSGEATTYEDALGKVMAAIRQSGEGRANGVGGVPDLSVPTTAKEGGAEAVKRELEGICDIKKHMNANGATAPKKDRTIQTVGLNANLERCCPTADPPLGRMTEDK